MLPVGRFPIVPPNMLLKEALEEMGKWRLGIVCVSADEKLSGIMTDGDIRRMLLEVQKPFSAFFSDDVIDHAIVSPVVTTDETLLLDAVNLMEKKEVWDLPVTGKNGALVGLLHLHPVVQTLLDSA